MRTAYYCRLESPGTSPTLIGSSISLAGSATNQRQQQHIAARPLLSTIFPMSSSMYSQSNSTMAPPQKPETFMLSNEAQQSLPQDAQVALQQVDNREYIYSLQSTAAFAGSYPIRRELLTPKCPADRKNSKIFSHLRASRLDTRPVYPKVFATHRRVCFLCAMVSFCQFSDSTACCVAAATDTDQEQPLPHLRYRHCQMPILPLPSLWPTGQKFQEIRGGHFLRSAEPEIWD